MKEALDSWLVCGEFRGFEQGALFLEEMLEEWDVKLESKLGQRALKSYVEKAIQGFYGDFNRWIVCNPCGKEFRPNHSLAYAKQVLSVGVLCPACVEKENAT